MANYLFISVTMGKSLISEILVEPFQSEEELENFCLKGLAGLVKSILTFAVLRKENRNFIIKLILFCILSVQIKGTSEFELKLLFLETFCFWLLQQINSPMFVIFLFSCFYTHEKSSDLMYVLNLKSFISFVLRSVLRISDNIFIIICILGVLICYLHKDNQKTILDLMLCVALVLCGFSMYRPMSSTSILFDVFVLSCTWMTLKF